MSLPTCMYITFTTPSFCDVVTYIEKRRSYSGFYSKTGWTNVYKCCIFLQREKNISKQQQTLKVSNYMSELYIFSNPIDTMICYAGMLKYLSKKQSLKWILEYAVYDLNWVMFLQKYYNYYLTSIPKKSLIYYQSPSSNNKLHSSMKP